MKNNSCKTASVSVIVTARNDFFAGGPQDERMLELSCVAALNVDQRRVRFHGTLVAEVLQRHLVLGAADAIQPAFAEGQGT